VSYWLEYVYSDLGSYETFRVVKGNKVVNLVIHKRGQRPDSRMKIATQSLWHDPSPHFVTHIIELFPVKCSNLWHEEAASMDSE
jgi:hypothetical protein